MVCPSTWAVVLSPGFPSAALVCSMSGAEREAVLLEQVLPNYKALAIKHNIVLPLAPVVAAHPTWRPPARSCTHLLSINAEGGTEEEEVCCNDFKIL